MCQCRLLPIRMLYVCGLKRLDPTIAARGGSGWGSLATARGFKATISNKGFIL
jgi:hypothetical protein